MKGPTAGVAGSTGLILNNEISSQMCSFILELINLYFNCNFILLGINVLQMYFNIRTISPVFQLYFFGLWCFCKRVCSGVEIELNVIVQFLLIHSWSSRLLPSSGLISIAESVGVKLLPPRKKITVMLMGNHSAGKSSFINWYISSYKARCHRTCLHVNGKPENRAEYIHNWCCRGSMYCWPCAFFTFNYLKGTFSRWVRSITNEWLKDLPSWPLSPDFRPFYWLYTFN